MYRISSRGDENALKLDCSDDLTTLCLYNNHWIVYFKSVNCIVCEWYINKAGLKKKKKEKWHSVSFQKADLNINVQSNEKVKFGDRWSVTVHHLDVANNQNGLSYC